MTFLLTSLQIDILDYLSYGVWLGVKWGLLGGLVSIALRALRERSFLGFFRTSLFAAVPCAGYAIATSLGIVLLQMIFCEFGDKGGWKISLWSEFLQVLAVFVTGIAAGFMARPVKLDVRKVLVWTYFGACIGAIGNVGDAFSGYYVTKSNAPLIHNMVTGLFIGGLIIPVWHLLAATLIRTDD